MADNEFDPKEQQSKLREFLREWGFDVVAFEERAKRSVENRRGDLSEVTGALRQTLSSTKQTLIDLQKSKQPVASELKSGFERAWDEIEKAFTNARQKMRETREAETAVAEKHDDTTDDKTGG